MLSIESPLVGYLFLLDSVSACPQNWRLRQFKLDEKAFGNVANISSKQQPSNERGRRQFPYNPLAGLSSQHKQAHVPASVLAQGYVRSKHQGRKTSVGRFVVESSLTVPIG